MLRHDEPAGFDRNGCPFSFGMGGLFRRNTQLQRQRLTRDQLLLKLGAAKKEAGRAYTLVAIRLPDPGQEVVEIHGP